MVDHFHRIERPAADVDRLSPREQAILKLLSQGLYYKEIGDHLGLSVNTVKTHLHEIYAKLHVRSRTQATLKYLAKRQ